MARNDNNLLGVYNTLKKEGYTPPSFDEFVSDMSDDSNLRGVYETLKKSGYEPPEYEIFKADMFGTQAAPAAATAPKPVVTDVAKPAAASPADKPADAGGVAKVADVANLAADAPTVPGWTLPAAAKAASPADKPADAHAKAASAAPAEEPEAFDAELAVEKVKQQTAALKAQTEQHVGDVYRHRGIRKGFVRGFEPIERAEYNQATGEFEKHYISATGERFDTKVAARAHTSEMRRALDVPDTSPAALLDQVNTRLADVNKRIAEAHKGREAAEREFAANNPFTSMYAGTVGAGRQVAQGEKRGADISSLLAERSMLEKTRRRLLAATELKKSGDPQSDSMFNGFFDVWNNLKNLTRGVVDALKDPSIYTFGYTDVNEASNLLGIKERLDRGEELTETEFHLAMSAALAHQGDQVAAPNLPNYINGYFYIASKSAVYN